MKNRKSADLEEFSNGLKELSSFYNSVWLKNVIKKCCGDLFDVWMHGSRVNLVAQGAAGKAL